MIDSVHGSQFPDHAPVGHEDDLVPVPPLLLAAPQDVGFVVQGEDGRFWSSEGWVPDWMAAHLHDCPDCCGIEAERVERATGRPAFPRSLHIVAVTTPA